VIRLVLALLAVIALDARTANACDKHACAGDQAGNCPAAEKAAAAQGTPDVAPAAGMRVNIDPNTGAYIDHPVAEPGAKANVATGPATPPVEAPLPSGGSKINTRGVRQEITATANPGGAPVTGCNQTGAPDAPQN
jgi:hypothetical protein